MFNLDFNLGDSPISRPKKEGDLDCLDETVPHHILGFNSG